MKGFDEAVIDRMDRSPSGAARGQCLYAGKEIGPALLKDALRRAAHTADAIGARAVLV